MKGGDFMAVNFFKAELNKIYQRFNATFGILEVFIIEKRYSAILNIINLGLLERKIKQCKKQGVSKRRYQGIYQGKGLVQQPFRFNRETNPGKERLCKHRN